MIPDRAPLGLAGILDALREIDESESSACSSPQSYHSNGHDGLTDIDSDTEPQGPSAAQGPSAPQGPPVPLATKAPASPVSESG